MPSTRPTVDPVLDILEEMGYDFDELDGDGYKRSLKEAIIKLTIKDPKDPRIGILTLEFQKVKGSRKVEPKEKRTTIRGDKLMGREPKKDAPSPTAGKPKLLTGVGKFNTDDVKPADVDKKQKDSSDLKPDKLDSIAKTVESIALLLRRQFNLEKKQQRDSRRQQSKDDRDAREDKLEGKPKDKKTGLLPKAIKKPALSFFDKIKNFFLNIVLGASVIKIMEWLKDPANQVKIAQFKDFLIENAPLILGGLAALALLPVVGGLVGMIGGIMGGLSMLGLAVPLLPIILKGMLIAAVIALTIAAGKKVVRGVENIFTGGEAFTQGHNKAKSKLEAAGLQDLGRAWRGGGTPIRVKVSDNHHGTGKPSWKTVNYEDLNPTQKKAWDEYMVEKNRIIGLKEQMHTELRDKVHVGGSIENERDSYSNEEFLAISKIEDMDERKKKLKEFRKETARLQKEERIKIEQKYSKEALNIQKNSSSANIDKDVKTNTEVPAPSSKGKGGVSLIDSGGADQGSSGGSSGGGGEAGEEDEMFSSEDPNDPSVFSSKSLYNLGVA